MRLNTLLLLAILALSGGVRADDEVRNTQASSETLAAVTSPVQENSNSDRSHWLRGEVRIDDAWVHFSQVGDLAHRKTQLQRYRDLRGDSGSSLEDQLYLADECRKLQLPDEERAHLEQVVRQSPNHSAARQRLGDQLFEGSWLTRRDQQQLRSRLADLAIADKRYGAQIRKAAEQLNDSKQRRRDAAEKVLNEIQDPAAIPLMEQAFGYNTEASQIVYLNWLDRVPSWLSAAAMARLSLTSESPRVRAETAKRLSERPWEEFVPVYMSEMALPTESNSSLVRFGPLAQLRIVTTSETSDTKKTTVMISRYAPPGTLRISFMRQTVSWNSDSDSDLGYVEGYGYVDGYIEMKALARKEEMQLVKRNAEQANRNGRACRALSRSMGIEGAESPEKWWKWWNAAQGYTDTQKQQVFSNYEENWHYAGNQKRQVARPSTRIIVSSCFVAGTLIQTESGLVPIESVKIGDRVLSQDVETGALAYKPVLRTTVRESKDTRVIRAGSDQLQCSPGHPFWVNGQAWVQAHNLTDQSQFHTIDGAMSVTSVNEDLGATVYNLEVADFNTYFVGNGHILSHDVTVREPTDMIEPGTVKPELAAYSK